MTSEKLSSWWETPGLGELSMAAGSIPLGLGTYVAGTKLLNANPRVAAAAGATAGVAQAANQVLQARTNGRAGLVTPSSPLTDVGRSILTGGMGALGGIGLSSIANLGPPTKKTVAALGALISAADFARRRGRAAIERRAYNNELERQMEDYYSKEAQVTWYGHEKLSGSLLGNRVDVKPSVIVLPNTPVSIDFLLQKFAAESAKAVGTAAPARPVAQNRPNQGMRAAAERSARNAVASGRPANNPRLANNFSGNPVSNRRPVNFPTPNRTNQSARSYSDKNPAVRAAAAAMKPTVSPARPMAPVARPTAARPTAPAARPIAPAARPTAARPTAPAARPTAPAARPTAPAARPTAPAARPATTPNQNTDPMARIQNSARAAIDRANRVRGFATPAARPAATPAAAPQRMEFTEGEARANLNLPQRMEFTEGEARANLNLPQRMEFTENEARANLAPDRAMEFTEGEARANLNLPQRMEFTESEARANLAPDQVMDFSSQDSAAAMAPNLTDRMFGAQRLGQNQVARSTNRASGSPAPAARPAARPAAPPQTMDFTEDESIINLAPDQVMDFSGQDSAAAMAPNLTDRMYGANRLGQNQVARATNRVRGFF